jgi:hypothetical protein
MDLRFRPQAQTTKDVDLSVVLMAGTGGPMLTAAELLPGSTTSTRKDWRLFLCLCRPSSDNDGLPPPSVIS